jgi:hypothetical protein
VKFSNNSIFGLQNSRVWHKTLNFQASKIDQSILVCKFLFYLTFQSSEILIKSQKSIILLVLYIHPLQIIWRVYSKIDNSPLHFCDIFTSKLFLRFFNISYNRRVREGNFK